MDNYALVIDISSDEENHRYQGCSLLYCHILTQNNQYIQIWAYKNQYCNFPLLKKNKKIIVLKQTDEETWIYKISWTSKWVQNASFIIKNIWD